MISVLRNSGEELRHVFGVDGVPTDADGAVTIQITKADGTELVAAGTATTHGSTGQYKYVLAPQTTLNLLTVTWTGDFGGVTMSQTDQVELVGGVYVSLQELLAMQGLATVAASTLADKRREFEDLAERYCGIAMVPRYARQQVVGNGSTSILLPTMNGVMPALRTLLTVTATDTAGVVTPFTLTNWTFTDYGQITTDGTALTRTVNGERNLTIEHEHGLDSPPFGVVSACKTWVRHQVLQDRNSGARDVLREINETGIQIQYSTPDWDAGRPTGLLDVDRALAAVGRRAPVVA